ncbi:MAG: hypothetical protein CVV21_12475 [Candidatus Goldiibacteriota bacterium HGW-Goldbacteria-1]|jgi:hypothetical protein|nr:MAG: hypothetical protein CVV21_12475 [Candidatus Goldiibacteriota bacterium HGW-Goldbacteria-1]
MKKTIFLVLIVFAAALFVGCNQGKVVAKVDGKVITESDLKAEIDNLPANLKPFASDPGIRKNILDNMILDKVIMGYAEKEGITKKKEVLEAAKETEKSIRAEIESQLAMLKKQQERISEMSQKEAVMKEVFEKGVNFAEIPVTEAEIKDAYDRYSARRKSQDPNAKVELLAQIKDNLKLGVARQKWVEQLKAAAKIEIEEKAFELPAAPLNSGIKLEAPKK